MKELIDKSAIVAEIKRRRDFIYKRNPLLINSKYCIEEDNAILDFINTLEVKEVDLEEEFDKYCENLYVIDIQEAPFTEMYDCAKYFYELGLKAKGE